jgi:hypothetical protein
MRVTADPRTSPLDEYLQQLTEGARPGQLLDLRWVPPGQPMRQCFLPAQAPWKARQLILAQCVRADVFVGVALRDRRSGARTAISGSRLLFVECDRVPDGRVLGDLPPTIEIASGTAGHRHLYWRLDTLAAPGETEHANRRLATVLGGDLRCVDVVRILRPPETLNHKTAPPRPVRLLALRSSARYSLSELLEQLPPLPCPASRPVGVRGDGRAPSSELDRRLRAIPTSEYVFALTGRRPNRRGKVLCPFHQERHPSLHLYADGTFYCFGCQRGGSIIDFAAALWHLGTRGQDFFTLRRRLASTFALTPT